MHILAILITIVVFFWIISFPLYFFHRKDIKRYVHEMKERKKQHRHYGDE